MIHQIAQTAQLANIIDPGIQQIAQLGIGASAFVVLAWLVRHVTTKTIPDMMKSYAAQSKLQLEAFERMNKETRSEFRDILEADRHRHLEREQTQQKAFSEALNRIECRHTTE